MRILLAVDNTAESEAVVKHVLERPMPEDTSIEVLTVLHSKIPAAFPMPALAFTAAHAEEVRWQAHEAPEFLERVADRLRREARVPAEITTKMLEGEPSAVIGQEAAEWEADLVVVGADGRGPIAKAFSGSKADALGRIGGEIEIVKTARAER
jgi:nucleotide-binding universal stress UspA family protein